jgi:DNA-binding GntR family transcriptional regulator
VKSISAHVKNGQIVPDEPIGLFEGEALEVLVADDIDDEMTPEELEELDAALAESEAQFARGEFVEAREFALKLFARL